MAPNTRPKHRLSYSHTQTDTVLRPLVYMEKSENKLTAATRCRYDNNNDSAN